MEENHFIGPLIINVIVWSRDIVLSSIDKDVSTSSFADDTRLYCGVSNNMFSYVRSKVSACKSN